MQTLRATKTLARFVLACFLLAIGAAVASPLVSPQSLQLVCSAGGVVQFVSLDADGSVPGAKTPGHCPLCIVAGAPPSWVPLAVMAMAPAGAPLAMSVRSRIATRSAPPLPARGPPAIS